MRFSVALKGYVPLDVHDPHRNPDKPRSFSMSDETYQPVIWQVAQAITTTQSKKQSSKLEFHKVRNNKYHLVAQHRYFSTDQLVPRQFKCLLQTVKSLKKRRMQKNATICFAQKAEINNKNKGFHPIVVDTRNLVRDSRMSKPEQKIVVLSKCQLSHERTFLIFIVLVGC